MIERVNDPRGLNRTFVLCYLYFCFCLELSPLVMKHQLLIQIRLLEFGFYCTNTQRLRMDLNKSPLQSKSLPQGQRGPPRDSK